MTPPLTNFETTGEWTTLEQESIFLGQIIAETDMITGVAGQSGLGEDISWYAIGDGETNTLMVTGLVHGNEPAGRESVLAWLRDVAYSTDPAVLAYLQNHRIVCIPTVSPDSIFIRRYNALGRNPNREFFTLHPDSPETHAWVTVFNTFSPHLVVDCHEYNTAGQDWWYFGSNLPSTHPDIVALENDLISVGVSEMSSRGYSHRIYREDFIPRSCATAYAATRHAVAMTSETNFRDGVPAVRVGVHDAFLSLLIPWHEAHTGEIVAARQASIDWSLTHAGREDLVIRDDYIFRDTPEAVRLEGYQIVGEIDPWLVEMHGIYIDESGFAPMQQVARSVLPHVLDPESMDSQVEAVRVARVGPDPEPVPPREPLPNRPLLGYRVHIGGSTRDVIGMKAKINGGVRDILMPG